MEIERLVVMMVNDLLYYLLKKDAHLVGAEIVTLERDFYLNIQANVPAEAMERVERDLRTLSKMKEHPELKYYSGLSRQVGDMDGIYNIAPYIKKLDYAFQGNELKIEIFVER